MEPTSPNVRIQYVLNDNDEWEEVVGEYDVWDDVRKTWVKVIDCKIFGADVR